MAMVADLEALRAPEERRAELEVTRRAFPIILCCVGEVGNEKRLWEF